MLWIKEQEIDETTMTTGVVRDEESEEIRKRRKLENREPDGRSGSPKQTKASPCRCVDFNGGRVASLDDGALTEILVRLPVKSLVRFKSVCKSWLSLISSDYFRALHTLCKPPPSLILTTHVSGSVFYKPIVKRTELFYSNQIVKRSENPKIIPFDIDGIADVKILNCANGLMLLKDWSFNKYYVYNPTTKHSDYLRLDSQYSWLHLVFDPSVSPHYKIVCLRLPRGDGLLQHIEVFSSESGTWSVCGEPFEIGALTHVVQCKSLIYFIHNGYLHCFDIVKNDSLFIVCPLPERAGAAVYSYKLQESNGCLYYCALYIDFPCGITAACLWELQVNGNDPRPSKWLLKYDHRVHSLPCSICLVTFITETSTMLIHFPGKIVAYSFLDRSYKELLDLETPTYSVHVHQFGETLALP